MGLSAQQARRARAERRERQAQRDQSEAPARRAAPLVLLVRLARAGLPELLAQAVSVLQARPALQAGRQARLALQDQ